MTHVHTMNQHGSFITFDIEQGFVDTTPPVVTVPSNQEFSTTDSSKYYTFSASATDIMSGNIVPYCLSSVGGPGGSLAFATSGTYGGSFVAGIPFDNMYCN